MKSYATKSRMKMLNDIKKMNGYYNLSPPLRKKLDRSESEDGRGRKICEFFSWDEFCEVFNKTTYLFILYHNNTTYRLIREKGTAYFCSDGSEKEDGFNGNFKTAQDLLDNARIDGRSLQEIWDELTL